MPAPTSKPTIFISYAHKDEEWRQKLRPHLGVLKRYAEVDFWDDRRIEGGQQWYREIKQAIVQAKVAICLVSKWYLDSDFCSREEIPALLRRRDSAGLVILPVLLSPCPWKHVPWLREIQMLPGDGKSVQEDYQGIEDTALANVVDCAYSSFRGPSPASTVHRISAKHTPAKVYLNGLEIDGREIFGRHGELRSLDRAWEAPEKRIALLVGPAGIGKTTLMARWIALMAAEGYGAARSVYGHAFNRLYDKSQDDRGLSFVWDAIVFWSGKFPSTDSPVLQGEMLAELVVSAEPSILLLDSLDIIQEPKEIRGCLTDIGLAVALRKLARSPQKSLCVVTTRYSPPELMDLGEAIEVIHLGPLSPEAGRALIRDSTDAIRSDAELESYVMDVKGASAMVAQGAEVISQESDSITAIVIKTQKDGELSIMRLHEGHLYHATLLPTQLMLFKRFISRIIENPLLEPDSSNTMFELLIPNRFKGDFAVPENKDYEITLDLPSAELPWEFLQDRKDIPTEPWAIEHNVMRTFRPIVIREKARSEKTTPPSALLLMGANSISSVDSDPEELGMKTVARALVATGLEVKSCIGAEEAVCGFYAKPYRIMHCAAHVVFEYPIPSDPEAHLDPCRKMTTVTGVVLGCDLFLTLAEFNQLASPPELVVISCGRQPAIMDKSLRGAKRQLIQFAPNFALALLQLGVKAVICCGWVVTDEGATCFESEFYRLIGTGASIREAVRSARAKTYERSRVDPTWGAYQCYGNHDYKVIDTSKLEGEHLLSEL